MVFFVVFFVVVKTPPTLNSDHTQEGSKALASLQSSLASLSLRRSHHCHWGNLLCIWHLTMFHHNTELSNSRARAMADTQLLQVIRLRAWAMAETQLWHQLSDSRARAMAETQLWQLSQIVHTHRCREHNNGITSPQLRQQISEISYPQLSSHTWLGPHVYLKTQKGDPPYF